MAVDECDDMRMVEALKNLDLGVEVLLQLPVKLRQVDRLDGNIGA